MTYIQAAVTSCPSRSLFLSASTIRKHCLACRAWLQAKIGRLCGVNRPPRPNPLPSCQQSSSLPPFFLSSLPPLPPAQRRHCLQLSAQQTAAPPLTVTGNNPNVPIGTSTIPSTATLWVAATMRRRIHERPNTPSRWPNLMTAPTRSTKTPSSSAVSVT